MDRLAPLVCLMLLVVAAGAAVAQGPPADADARRDAMKARRAELMEARNASLDSFREDRTAALAEYRAANNATRASFLENKTLAIDACRAARNATTDDDGSRYATCVSDALKPLIQKARDEHRAAREAFLDRVVEARRAAIAAFAEARRAADARHGRPAEG